ncbi:NlpC P60 family protein [Lentilactobacillus senioris DSM 24302 = JCM 17472]|uniref:NlpC P60 family protein n=1 Tax=Lentilactobacillus senioris DSM 24302 = JCM 17472 TaxID=1423802 RepID=A0A0R2D2D0_9LACO|nr:NlpC P60 family protein [Lentilactobacillus senioris DSM 24302 = JCM 17472]
MWSSTRNEELILKLPIRLTLLATLGLMGAGIATTDVASADTYTQPQTTQATQTYNAGYANQGTNYNYNYNYNYANNSYSANSVATNTSTANQATANTTTTSSNSAVVNYAKKLANMNIPYVWGGASLSGMDCSGLTAYVYQNAAGISLGHNTAAQEGQVTYESVSAAQPGDLLFWGSQGASYHVAIYIGNNQYVAAPQPGSNVEVETISSAFMPSFAGRVK